ILLKEPSLKGYNFPDPKAAWRYEGFNKELGLNKDLFCLCDIGFSLFERAWTLRGMENLLCDMYENQEFVNVLLDAITEFNLTIIDESVKYPIDGMRFGDDWGQQAGLIMGPELWRKFIKPRIKKMYARVKSHGLKVFIHSCGDVEEIFPDLIEVGLDVFNPFQPEAYDIFKIKKLYGDKLSFYGGMSTQKILPFGTPEAVKIETVRLLKEIGNNGGYIFSPAHATPGDVPVENMTAMIEVLQNQEKYR
ncbi:MAG: uroporphyrinogen decarboxylase family protein, partial [Candidatus Firestonebacteria bacterium]